MMFRIFSLCSALLLLLAEPLYSQSAANERQEEIHFTEFWVWEYPNDRGELVEFGIYRAPQKDLWLLTLDSYGDTDGMTSWFLVRPNGRLVQSAPMEHAGKSEFYNHRLSLSAPKQMPSSWKKENARKKFGTPEEDFGVFEGQAYVSEELFALGSEFYFYESKTSFAALSHFNDLEIDAKLPVHFPKNIPQNFVPMAQYHGQRGKIFEFKGVFPTSYYIYLPKS